MSVANVRQTANGMRKLSLNACLLFLSEYLVLHLFSHLLHVN